MPLNPINPLIFSSLPVSKFPQTVSTTISGEEGDSFFRDPDSNSGSFYESEVRTEANGKVGEGRGSGYTSDDENIWKSLQRDVERIETNSKFQVSRSQLRSWQLEPLKEPRDATLFFQISINYKISHI